MLPEVENEAQRSDRICLRLHSWSVAEMGFQPASPDSPQCSSLCARIPEVSSPCGCGRSVHLSLADCLSEGLADLGGSRQGASARWRPHPVFCLQPVSLHRLIAARWDVLFPSSGTCGRDREQCSHADREPVLAQLAACAAPSSESDPSASSGTAIQAQLPSWYLWVCSGVTGLPAGNCWARLICLPLAWLWKSVGALTEPFTLGGPWRKPQAGV